MVKSGYTSHYSFQAVGYASSISDLLDTGSTRKGLGEKRTIVAKKKLATIASLLTTLLGLVITPEGGKEKKSARDKLATGLRILE